MTFLLEERSEPLSCLLNPDSLVVRRAAGVRARASLGGSVTGTALADSPLLVTGGGATELLLELLFDVSFAGRAVASENVRELTAPFFALSENVEGAAAGAGRPPRVRFIWGKSWNVPAVVVAVAERLEFFNAGGEPRRSWMRLRLLRVSEEAPSVPPVPRILLAPDEESLVLDPAVPEARIRVHEVVGGTAADGELATGERLEEIAQRYYGNPGLWRLLAVYNGVTDPLHLEPGVRLRVPPLDLLTRAGG